MTSNSTDRSEPIGPHQLGRRGPWEIQHSTVRYQDPWVSVVRDDVTRPDGASGTYCVVYLKPGVSVIAMGSHQEVYLTREYHYGVDRVTLESVSGGRDLQEPPLEAAQRELKEELGIEAATWLDLGTVDPFTANVVSPTQLYLAMDLRFGDTEMEGTEQIQMERVDWHDAMQMVYDGTISHAPSAVALLKVDAWMREVARFPVVRGQGSPE